MTTMKLDGELDGDLITCGLLLILLPALASGADAAVEGRGLGAQAQRCFGDLLARSIECEWDVLYWYYPDPHNNHSEAVRFQQEVFFAIISCLKPTRGHCDFIRKHDFTLYFNILWNLFFCLSLDQLTFQK